MTYERMIEIISRKSSIPDVGESWDEINKAYDMAIELLKETRPQGEWIDYSNEGFVECPFCGSAINCEDNIDELHFCWNCGAELRGGK